MNQGGARPHAVCAPQAMVSAAQQGASCCIAWVLSAAAQLLPEVFQGLIKPVPAAAHDIATRIRGAIAPLPPAAHSLPSRSHTLLYLPCQGASQGHTYV
jgi:hypothetical protein